MNGDLSLSKALGGLRIANPDDTISSSAPAGTSPAPVSALATASAPIAPIAPTSAPPAPPAPPASAPAPTPSPAPSDLPSTATPTPPDTAAIEQALQASSLAIRQASSSREPSPAPSLRRHHTFDNVPTGPLKAPHPDLSSSASSKPHPDPYLHARGNAPFQSGAPPRARTPTRPMSSIYGSSANTSFSDGASGHANMRNEPARSASYRLPSQRDSHVPSSYVAGVPSREENHTDRMYHSSRPNPSGSSPMPPRRTQSKGMGGGYASGPAAGERPAAGAHKDGLMLKSSEEWKERGAAVGVRREVDANGKPIMRTVKKGVQDFSFGRILGEGSYSTVYLASDRQTRKEYAIKVLEKRHIIKEKKVKYVNIEKNTLNRLTEHPGIVRLYYTFQDEASLYYVLDLCNGGELLGTLKKTGTFDVDCTRFYGAQILDSIKYMHSRGVIHRDLKPENVLLDEHMHIKITDFGTAKLLPDPREPRPADGSGGPNPLQDNSRSASFVGTAEYVSPELLMDKSASKASDLWAYGCIIYQLLAGRPPFKGASEYLTFQKIVNLEYEFPYGFPPAARDLVERCLVLDPARRLTIEHIMNHEFFDGQAFGKELWRTKAPRLQAYHPPTQEPSIIQLNGGAAPPPQSMPGSRGNPLLSGGGSGGSGLSTQTQQKGQRPARIITELPPPTQLDLDWSPVLTRQNERILKLGDLMVVSAPIPNSPHGKGSEHGDGHKKLARFFGGSTTKKRPRLVMVTSSGRIVLAPAGGDEKKAKQEISLLGPDCVWRTQTDAKGQAVWCVDTGGTHYSFEEIKSGSSLAETGMAGVEEWVESLDRAKDMALSQNLLSSYRNEEFGEMSSSMSSPASTLGNRAAYSSQGQGNGEDSVVSERKRNRFSKRQSKQGLGAGLGAQF